MKILGLSFVVVASCVYLSNAQSSEADCTTALGGGIPAAFSDAPASTTDNGRFALRECVGANTAECKSIENRLSGNVVTSYRLNTDYILTFDSNDVIYDLFLLTDPMDAFTPDIGGYETAVELNPSGATGSCFSHVRTNNNIDGFLTAQNRTDLIWRPFTIFPTTLTFRVLAQVAGTDIHLTHSVNFALPNCPASDVGIHVKSCDARYNGQTCVPECDNGYLNPSGGTVDCTGNVLVPQNGACSQKIDPYCTQTDEAGQDFTYNVCTNKEIDDTCTGYCLNAAYSENGPFTCVANSVTTGIWDTPNPPCTYIGNCPVSEVLDGEGVKTPSPTDAEPCFNADVGETCEALCEPGYGPQPGLDLLCTAGGWSPAPDCTIISDFCNIADIVGDKVIPGTCTTRTVDTALTGVRFCNYDCNETGYLAVQSQIKCDGTTPIGWSRDTFSCAEPLPTPAPVPTLRPTAFPLPTEAIIPTPPTPPTKPTVNPFFLNQPTANANSQEGIYIIVGAGGGAALFAAIACVGISLRRSAREYQAIYDEKDAAANHYVDDRFGAVQKQKYNAFDNW